MLQTFSKIELVPTSAGYSADGSTAVRWHCSNVAPGLNGGVSDIVERWRRRGGEVEEGGRGLGVHNGADRSITSRHRPELLPTLSVSLSASASHHSRLNSPSHSPTHVLNTTPYSPTPPHAEPVPPELFRHRCVRDHQQRYTDHLNDRVLRWKHTR